MTNKIKNVDEFILNELRGYAVYDNERSIPSVVDGLKISQRKVIFTAFKTMRPMVDLKTSSLGSSASALTHYKHNENSIIDTVIGLAKDFAGSNNYPLLLKEGQFGTAINNENSAPRYIFVKRDNKLDDMFEADDREIVDYLVFDGDSIEPMYYLPKLPLIIINGTKGIGNGYSSSITLRDTKKVAEYITQKLTDPKSTPDKSLLYPSYNGFTGEVEVHTDKSFTIKGRIERVDLNTTIIKDLPPTGSFQYEKYKARTLLPFILDSKSGVTDFIDESTEGNWNITIKHSREIGRKTDAQLIEFFKITDKVTENITVWGFDNKLKIFESVYDLVDYWIENRLTWVETRKQHVLEKSRIKSEWLEDFLKLIELWISDSDIVKLKKDDLIAKLKTVVDNDKHISKFLDQNIMALTAERLDKLRKDIAEALKFRKTYQKKTIQKILADDIEIFTK